MAVCQTFLPWPADLPLASASSDMITKSRALLSAVLGVAVSYRVAGVTGAGITEWCMAQGCAPAELTGPARRLWQL